MVYYQLSVVAYAFSDTTTVIVGDKSRKPKNDEEGVTPEDQPHAQRARRSIPAKPPKVRTIPRGSTIRDAHTCAGRRTCSQEDRSDRRRTYRSTPRRLSPSANKNNMRIILSFTIITEADTDVGDDATIMLCGRRIGLGGSHVP